MEPGVACGWTSSVPKARWLGPQLGRRRHKRTGRTWEATDRTEINEEMEEEKPGCKKIVGAAEEEEQRSEAGVMR